MCRFTNKALNGKEMAEIDGPILGTYIVEQAVQVPVMINYKVGKKRFQKIPDQADIALILKTESLRATEWCPTFQLPTGFNTRQPIESHGLTHSSFLHGKKSHCIGGI